MMKQRMGPRPQMRVMLKARLRKSLPAIMRNPRPTPECLQGASAFAPGEVENKRETEAVEWIRGAINSNLDLVHLAEPTYVVPDRGLGVDKAPGCSTIASQEMRP